MWFVYGDQVFENKADRPDESAAYVGSATRDPADGAGFNRVGDYERAKRRADAGIDVSIETDHSKHLRMGLRKGATMELRVLAVFDPMAFDAVVPLAVEGIYLDFLQSFDRDWVYTEREVYSFSTPMCLKLSMDALDSIDREDRDISAVTLSVTAEVRELMKEEIIALRKRFVSMSVDTKNPDEVVQLNLQLFPLVKKEA